MIRKRGKVWTVTVYDPATQGKRWIGTFDTRKAAEQAEADGRTIRRVRVSWSLASKGEKDCRNCGAVAENLHHIVPLSLVPGDPRINDPALNGLPLCLRCHRGWHSQATAIPLDVLRVEEKAFALSVVGQPWLVGRYPGIVPEDINEDLLDEVRMLRAELAWHLGQASCPR